VNSKDTIFSCPEVSELRLENASTVILQLSAIFPSANDISSFSQSSASPVFLTINFSPRVTGLSFRIR